MQNNIYTSRNSQLPARQVSSRVVQFNRSSSPKISFNISSQPRPVANSPPPPALQSVTQSQLQPPPLTTHNNRDLVSLKSMTTVTALRNESNPSELKSENSKLYDFKGSTASEKNTKMSRIRR